MSGSSENKYRLPNSSVPIQAPNGFVNHSWYLYLAQLGKATQPGSSGLASLGVGNGLVGADANGNPVSVIVSTGTLSLSLDYYGDSPGTILARGAEAWEGVAPGFAGAVLTSAGEGEPPFWGSTSEQALADAPPLGLLGNTGDATAPAVGVTLTDLLDAFFGSVWGGVVFRGERQWSFLPPPDGPGLRLTSGGPDADIYWARPGGNIEQALGAPLVQGGERAPLGFVDANGNNIIFSDGFT